MTRPRNSNSDMDNLNKDSRSVAVPVGYVDEDGGEVVALQGDADAPYVIAHGRASSDGSTGLVAEPDGAAQRLALSPLGHAWSDLYVDGAPVSALNPLPTAGAAAGTTDTNIIEVAGVAVAVVTPGVLPVELVSTVWTKSIGSLAANGALLVHAGPPAGRIQRITISIFSGSGWLYICDDNAAVPTLALLNFPQIPFLTATLASPSYIDITFEDVGGLKYTTGILIGVSTTGPTYTVPGDGVVTGVVTVYYV